MDFLRKAYHQVTTNQHLGKFFVIEGIDGSGTSTQSGMLADYIANTLKLPTHLTYEPSNGPVGNMIREIFKGRVQVCSEEHLFDRQLALLFSADRHDHLYNPVDGITQLLKKGVNVVCTRYIFSSFVYHCNNDNDFDFVSNLNKEFPLPDLIIYLDNPVEISLQRLKGRQVLDTYETKEKLLTASKNYKTVISNYKGNLIKIRADLEIKDVNSLILERVNDFFKGHQ